MGVTTKIITTALYCLCILYIRLLIEIQHILRRIKRISLRIHARAENHARPNPYLAERESTNNSRTLNPFAPNTDDLDTWTPSFETKIIF